MNTPGRHHNPLQRGWAFVVDGLAALATVFIGILMVIICADIVFRNGFGSSLPLVSEIGALLVVLIVALQLASAIRADRLAHVEMVIEALSLRAPRLADILKALFALVGSAMVGIAAWASVGILENDYASGEFIGTRGLGTLPTWPFRTLIMVGMAVAAVEFAAVAVTHLRNAVKGKKAAHDPR
ncbi:TRAP transporter small permease subunit [Mesorhizobium xinjiangense]|uniref:TRAP transporter small permease subunit n=1 Tax=Mesorhizobium xinjiangense TaxID=2678685 RepID=UPI001F3FC829|nr:TRAP transporter small permease [Mesorhizobium xinjiangense]